MLLLLTISNVVFAFLLYVSVKKNLTLIDKIEELGSQVTNSLDMIDESYSRIAKVSEMPVLSDDPVVQQLLNDVKYAKYAVLLVANKLVSFDENDQDEANKE